MQLEKFVVLSIQVMCMVLAMVLVLLGFGKSKGYVGFVNFGGSSNVSQQSVEDLEKHVEILEEKLSGYQETKEQLAQTQNQLATLNRFLLEKYGSELPTFNQDVPPS